MSRCNVDTDSAIGFRDRTTFVRFWITAESGKLYVSRSEEGSPLINKSQMKKLAKWLDEHSRKEAK